MTNITIYDTEAERLNEAAAKVGESVATVIEWLVEDNLDDLVRNVRISKWMQEHLKIRGKKNDNA